MLCLRFDGIDAGELTEPLTESGLTGDAMALPSFQDLPLGKRDDEWDGDAAEGRVRKWAKAADGPTAKYRDAHVWYDAGNKHNFDSCKLLTADVVRGRLVAMPRGVMAAGRSCRVRAAASTSPSGTSPGEEPPGEVLPEDGRDPALGPVARVVPADASARPHPPRRLPGSIA